MAMNVGGAREGDPVSEINTTPLIDVMLVLLIMLIVTLPEQGHSVNLNTPAPCEACPEPVDDPLPLHIDVDFDGSLWWNGERIAANELDNRLSLEARRHPMPEVHIQPHRLARYEHVIHVMAAAQRKGLQRIGVIGGA